MRRRVKGIGVTSQFANWNLTPIALVAKGFGCELRASEKSRSALHDKTNLVSCERRQSRARRSEE